MSRLRLTQQAADAAVLSAGDLILYAKTDGFLYFKKYGGTESRVGLGATGGGTDTTFIENQQTVTTSYTLTTGKNALSVGPITINSGASVTIPSGARWVIL